MIGVFVSLLVISGICYLRLLGFSFYHWLKPGENGKEIKPWNTPFSIIIPARNEAENIGKCLQSIAAQNYPAEQFEIIVCDDFSSDDTVQKVREFALLNSGFSIRTIAMGELNDHSARAFKKSAIAEGICQSQYEWIITTDADCTRGTEWLSAFDNFIREKNPVMVAGPVVLDDNNSLFQKMQALEFAGLVGLAAGAMKGGFPLTCNGANLAYSKKAFYEAGGFAGIDALNSGDDEMLMLKMKRLWKDKVCFLQSKDAIVHTDALPTMKDFLRQRKRWVSKNRVRWSAIRSVIPILIYLFHALIIVGLAAGIWRPEFLAVALAGLFFKASLEWPFLLSVCRFFGEPRLALLYPIALLPQTFYVFFIGIYGIFGTYTWKGRSLR